MLDSRIEFDETVESGTGTLIYYFKVPKELLRKYIPLKTFNDAISAEISLETPKDSKNIADITISMSPTKEVEDGTLDYDWYDIYIPDEKVSELIRLADSTS